MADLKALERALVNADAAGDENAARQLAQAIMQMRGATRSGPMPVMPRPFDPERDMTGGERTLAGIGKGFADFGRGVGQLIGLTSREEVADARQRDEALMRTTGGKVGNFIGNVATIAPTALIPGAATIRGAALIGAGTGLAAPSVSTQETLQNTALGGALGAGGNLAMRGAGAGVNAAKGLLQPFYSGGQRDIAAQTLRSFASDPLKAAANLRGAQQLVPGSVPTMAQAADDVGLAQLERTLMNNPETAGVLAERYAQQRAARLAAIGGLAGDSAKRDAAVAARQAAAGPAYTQAKETSYLLDDRLGALLGRPSMQKALERAGRLSSEKGLPAPVIMKDGAPRAVSGEGMQTLKMGIDDLLSDPMAGIGKAEADAIKSTRGELLKAMESANPAFRTARETFARESVPINTMDVADELMKKLEPALARYGANTQEHAAAYARALEAAKDTVKKQTGINKPMDEVIDKQAAKLLDDIARDLGRKVKAENMGRGVGSNTAQNLSAQNLLRRTLGPTGLPQTWAENSALQAFMSPVTGVAKLAGSEQKITGLLAEAASDPALAAALLSQARQPSRMGLLGMDAMRYAPSLSMGGLLTAPAQ